MHNTSTHIGTLEILDRLPNSKNGNPRYLARVDGVTFCTPVDSSHGYGLPNYADTRVCVTVGTHYGRATLDTIGGA